MTSLRRCLVAVPLLVAWAAGGQLTAAQDAPAPPAETAPQQEQVQPPVAPTPAEPQLQLPQGLVPANSVQTQAASIPDIKLHRGKPLPYVRRMQDHVDLKLPAIDMNAPVVLTLDGAPISRSEFRRRALMLSAETDVDKYVTKILTDIEMARAKDAGETRDYAVSDAEIDARLEELKGQIRAQWRGQNPMAVEPAALGPSTDPNDPGDRAVKEFLSSIDESIGMAEYRRLLAGDAQFEKAFLPFPKEKVAGEAWNFENGPPPLDEPRPEWMPPSTWEAMGRGDQGRNMRSFLKQWAINGEPIPSLFRPSIVAMIRDGLIANVGVRFFFDETMPDEVFMRVGDHVVTTDEMWPLVAGRLADTDIEMIVRELLTLESVKRALQAVTYEATVTDPAPPPGPDGVAVPATTHKESRTAWMNDAQFREAWAAHEGQYAMSFIPLKAIIVLRGYTSADRFREHFRYRESFSRWKKATLTEEQVLDHYQGGGRLFFERGMVVVDMAFAPLGKRPFDDAGLEATRKELADAMEEARAAGGDDWFAAVMAKYPGPDATQQSDGHTFQRNILTMQMAESELSTFLTGYSKTFETFYLADKGDVVGPWVEICRHHARGAAQNAGAWAIRVKDYKRSRPLGVFETREKDTAYEDWCDLNWFYWSQECLKALLPKVKVAGR